MRIESIYLRDVGPFDEVRIDLPEGKDPNLADVYLLTGPNGCGKSTLLYAIAALIAAGQKHLGQELITRRWRVATSLAAVKSGDVRRAAVWRDPSVHFMEQHRPFDDPFGGPDLPCLENVSGSLTVYETRPGNLYQVQTLHLGQTPQLILFEWAAFAYSGTRSVSDVHVEAIKDPSTNPFEQSLDFEDSADSRRLVHWVANQQFRRLTLLRHIQDSKSGYLSIVYEIVSIGCRASAADVIKQIHGESDERCRAAAAVGVLRPHRSGTGPQGSTRVVRALR